MLDLSKFGRSPELDAYGLGEYCAAPFVYIGGNPSTQPYLISFLKEVLVGKPTLSLKVLAGDTVGYPYFFTCLLPVPLFNEACYQAFLQALRDNSPKSQPRSLNLEGLLILFAFAGGPPADPHSFSSSLLDLSGRTPRVQDALNFMLFGEGHLPPARSISYRDYLFRYTPWWCYWWRGGGRRTSVDVGPTSSLVHFLPSGVLSRQVSRRSRALDGNKAYLRADNALSSVCVCVRDSIAGVQMGLAGSAHPWPGMQSTLSNSGVLLATRQNWSGKSLAEVPKILVSSD